MNARAILSQCALFQGLAEAALDNLTALSEWLDLPSGACLYQRGDAPAYFCLLASGRLRVSVGEERVGYTGRLEPVGEIGILTGEPRTADVHAIRDSLLLRIPRKPFIAFLHEHPTALMALTRLVVTRLRENQRQKREVWTRGERTFAILPAAPGLPVRVLAESLVRQLSGWPRARLITARHVDAELGPGAAQAPIDGSEAHARLTGWLNELEDRHRHVIFAADRPDDAWALRCLRQSDRVLLLADAAAPPVRVPVLETLATSGHRPPVELVLLRAEADPSPHTLEWRAMTGARAHYFIHPWHEPELASLARQVTGRGLGLVLGGGGARGFAHIGLIRALEQLEIPVDVMGGTSMGAFVSALLASGFDSVEMTQIARETFVNNNYLNDYILPKVSLIRGTRFLTRLKDVFGDRRIEELRRTYFCVSANLTSGATVVHESGPLSFWTGSSMSVPGVVPPIAHEGELLCDGGVVDNLPTDVMQSLERGGIVACSVSGNGQIHAAHAGRGQPDQSALLRWKGPGKPPSLAEIISRTATLTADTTGARQAAERADHFIRMPVQNFGMFDWQRLDELIDIGYRHAMEQLEPVRASLVR